MHARLGAGLIAALLVLSSVATAAAGSTPPSAGRDAPALAPLPAAFCDTFCTLTLDIGGSGSGRWQSTNSSFVPDGRIDCMYRYGVQDNAGSLCSHSYPPTETAHTIYFVATASEGSEACDSDECDPSFASSLILPGSATYAATEFRLKDYELQVSKSGTGSGVVTSEPSGITCGSTCSIFWNYNTSILLTADPDPGSAFAGWTGSCAEQPPECLIAIIALTKTTAIFNKVATSAPTKAPTQRPASTPVPTATTTDPSAAAASPGASVGASAPGLPTIGPGLGSAAPTAPPTVPAVGPGDNTTLAYILLLLALLLILAGIAYVAFTMGKRRRTPPPAESGPPSA